MAILQDNAITVLEDCRSALEEISRNFIFTAKPTPEEFFAIVDRARRQLRTSAKKLEPSGWREINRTASLLEELFDIYSHSFLETNFVHGVSFGTRLRDVVRGLRLLASYMENEQRFMENSPSLREGFSTFSPWPEAAFNRILRVEDALIRAIASFQATKHSGRSTPDLDSLGFHIERAAELVRQVRFAGPGNQFETVDELLTMIQQVETGFSRSLVKFPEIRGPIDDAYHWISQLRELTFDDADEDQMAVSPPTQVLAPFQFEIAEGRLALQPQPRTAKSNADAITAAALRALIGQAEDVYEDLKDSNHPRLLRAFKRLQDALVSESNVIEIGMLCVTCESQVHASTDELSQTLLALLLSFTKGVTDYASQFEEWQVFSDNAAEVTFTPEDGEQYARVARQLASDLEQRPEVDSRVPEALRQVADWNDRVDTPKSRLSVGRTVLNMFAVCYNKLIVHPAKTAVTSVGATVGVGIGVAAGAVVVTLVLNLANTYVSELAKTPEGAWLRPASRVIDAHLRKLENP